MRTTDQTRLRATPPARMRKAEAAIVAGVSYSTLHRAIARGELPRIKLGGKSVIIDRADLFEWLGRHKQRVQSKVKGKEANRES